MNAHRFNQQPRRQHLQRFRRLGITTLASAALIVGPTAPVAGAVSGSGDGIYWTSNSTWRVSGVALTAATRSGLTHAVNNVFGPTDLDPIYNPTANNSCATGADLCVYDANYGDSGWFGIAICDGTTSGVDPDATCSQHSAHINQYGGYPAGIAVSSYNVCHEVGHTVGLRHFNNSQSCLQRWIDGPGPLGSYATNITAGERNELNVHYK